MEINPLIGFGIVAVAAFVAYFAGRGQRPSDPYAYKTHDNTAHILQALVDIDTRIRCLATNVVEQQRQSQPCRFAQLSEQTDPPTTTEPAVDKSAPVVELHPTPTTGRTDRA